MALKVEIGKPLFDTHYIVEKHIGGGGEAQVYIVHPEGNDNVKYAAKIIEKPKDATDAFWDKCGDEAVTSARVSSSDNPNLVKTYDVFIGKDESIVFIQDLVKGTTLRNYLAAHKCIIPRKALNVFLKVLNGIQHLHHFKHQIIHRDLKPDNIMVTEDLSSVVIVDFGIASVIKTDPTDKKMFTTDTELRGTCSYMTPDYLTNWSENLSVQADIYSLGVILYEMIMGEVPFKKVFKADKSVDEGKTIKLPLQYDIPNISLNPSIPVMLENIIFRCMASKPQDKKYRYNNVNEIIDDVKKCLLLLNKRDDDVQLLKPVNQRTYQKDFKFKIDKYKSEQKWYKKWWGIGVIALGGLVIIIVSILFLFVF